MTLDFLRVSRLGARHLLRMVEAEPGGLAKVQSLSGHLEYQPLIEKILVGNFGATQLLVFVIGFDEILHDCTGLP